MVESLMLGQWRLFGIFGIWQLLGIVLLIGLPAIIVGIILVVVLRNQNRGS